MRRLACIAMAVLSVPMLAAPALADNPIVTHIFTADPATLVHDGRMYIYTGRDEASPTQNNFVMRQWRVFSSATPSDDPAVWTDHGSPLSIETFAWANADAWASEVVQGPDGRFYWFVSVNGFTDPGWMNIGVAVADTPLGPFTDAIGGPLISDQLPNSSALNIDPTVHIDDDGEIYLYWGSFWQPRMARLADSMTALEGPVVTPTGLAEFWEAPWLFERGGTYYMAYASNANINGDGCVTSSQFACIRYATASSPAGPWTHRGIVLDQVSSTTNHPAIEDFNGQWYMVYHTADAPGGGNFRRSVAIDPLFFNPGGTIQKVVQTPEPTEPEPEPTDNAALAAAPSASYTSPWEAVTAINDGIDPPASNDGLNPRWGTWPETGTHWVQLDWPGPVRLSGSDMYFFQDSTDGDGVGVKRPGVWSIQYRSGEQWVDVPDPSGYPTGLNGYNRTSFGEVTTTGLRATLQTRADADGVGVLEWRVYAVQPEAIAPVHAATVVGAPPTLPTTVDLTYPDGVRLPGQVVGWQRFDPALLEETGSFTLTGVVAGSLTRAEATVHVCSTVERGAVGGPLVSTGLTCLDGASVAGPVTVRAGAGLVALGATVAGPVSAARADELWLVGGALHGPLSAIGTTGRLEVTGVDVDGGVSLVDNRTGATPIVLSGTTVGGPLVCLGNEPAPTDAGVPNTVAGPTVGQCAGP
jgi:glycosyl hydrolase family 43/Big-like domain-containing protein